MKPILFNTEMVRAILDNRKRCTRRVVKPQPRMVYHDGKFYQEDNCLFLLAENHDGSLEQIVSPYNPGDILYVRETFRVDYLSNIPGSGRVHYKADDTYADFTFDPQRYDMMRRAQVKPGWRPNENMPREAARLFLRVTDVRVERLQDIDFEGCKAEGIWDDYKTYSEKYHENLARMAYPRCFSELWDSTIKKADLTRYGWTANPWVWVIEFERISKEAALKGGAE